MPQIKPSVELMAVSGEKNREADSWLQRFRAPSSEVIKFLLILHQPRIQQRNIKQNTKHSAYFTMNAQLEF